MGVKSRAAMIAVVIALLLWPRAWSGPPPRREPRTPTQQDKEALMSLMQSLFGSTTLPTQPTQATRPAWPELPAPLVLSPEGELDDKTFAALMLRMLAVVAEPRRPLGTMPAPSDKPRFLADIDNTAYPPAEAPKTPPLLRWDFSGKRVYAYDRVVRMESATAIGDRPTVLGHSVLSKSKLLLRSQGDRTATLETRDVQTDVTHSLGGLVSVPIRRGGGPSVDRGLREDGTLPGGDDDCWRILRTMFPLPPGPLKVGQSFEVPMAMDLPYLGAGVQAKGASKVTLSRYVKIGGRTCACLESAIQMFQPGPPGQTKPGKQRFMWGRSVMYFDVEDRSAVSSASALAMAMPVRVPALPSAPPAPKKVPAGGPATKPTVLRIDHLTQVKRAAPKPELPEWSGQ